MSATNRSGARRRHDSYLTPAWATDLVLDALPLPGGSWMDPCAGDGAIIKAVNDRRDDVTWTAVEIRPNCENKLRSLSPAGLLIADFLALTNPPRVDVVITNPPYKLARDFIERCCEIAPVVCMLLRLNFLASEDRQPWLSAFVPDVFVLPNRPDFTGGGGDATEYAWLVWERGAKRSQGMISILPALTRDQRRKRA